MEIFKQIYNDTQHTDMNSLAAALQLQPDVLSPVITHLAGRQDKRFPLTMLTEGVNNVRVIDGIEYEYRVMTRLNQARPVVETVTTTTAGIGGTEFSVIFPDKWFVKQYVLISRSGIKARIMADPEAVSNGYKYRLRLTNPDPAAYMPADDLVAGSLFASAYSLVGLDYSRGNASNWVAPALIRHKLGTLRKSYQMSGNAINQVVVMDLPTGNGTTRLWADFEEWQYMLQWKEECENFYWYGEQTYTNNGFAPMTDENGSPIIAGPGLLDQIINKDTYSVLTENKIRQVLRDTFYGMSDAQDKQVTLYTGTGGMEEFDKAMKSTLTGFRQFNDGKFINGSGRNMQLGGFFTSYQHIDGPVVNVVKVPMYDHGAKAQAGAKHPVTGLPLESYRMTFVDQSNYDGKPNVQMVTKKGRSFKRWAVAGSETPRGFSGNDLRASDIDGASVHFLKMGHICLNRFTTSFDMECVAGI